MQLRKWILLAGIVLMMTAQAASAAPEQSIEATLDGHRLDYPVMVINRNGNYFFNLPLLSQYLNCIVAWNIENHDLFLKLGKMNIKLYADNSTYYIDGKNQQLPDVPFEKDSQFWLPVQFLTKIGLTIESQNPQHLILSWTQNYLLGLESVTYQNRPAFLLIGTKNVKITDTVLSNPNRLVLTLPGVIAHFAMNEQINCASFSIVKQVGFDRSDPVGLKIIFNLSQTIGYQFIPLPDQPNRVLLVFNYLLKDVNAFTQDNEQKILITSSAPAQYQIKTTNAHQMIINLRGATLAGIPGQINSNGNWCRTIQFTQLNLQTVQIKLTLTGSSPGYVFQPSDNPNLLEIRPPCDIEQINWLGNASSGELHIASNGELFSTVSQAKSIGKLEVDFNDVRISPTHVLPNISNNLINGVLLTTVGPASLRLIVNLNRFVNYKLEYSTDRKQMTIHFNHSPVIGKTIVIDPGHGGIDNGAVGRQIREKDVNLEIAMRLKDLLEAVGADVILTRTDDYFVGLYERPYLANNLGAALFISVHTNNHPDLTVHGIEVFHFPGRETSQMLAQDILAKITQYTGLAGLGVKQDNFVVIREAQMPSILVEVGFLSNFQEESIIKTPEFKDNAAMGIYQGILDYCNNGTK
ncbi:MAG TPA: hypothetical protein DDW65_23420 [Firmicutes bacterium]|jgi:N-acetylmuramoyl-L-alanine amidase|nr:hypothetical protein [Bacillota bacterium]